MHASPANHLLMAFHISNDLVIALADLFETFIHHLQTAKIESVSENEKLLVSLINRNKENLKQN